MKEQKTGRPVLLDCDPGIDDALAIFMALASDELKVEAITAVAGNVPVERTALNALQLVELSGYEVEVASGAGAPLYGKKKTAESVHGRNGIGDIELPPPVGALSCQTARELIYRKALEQGGELEIIATGPLTNIASALLIYPDLKNLIRHIWIMGGSAYSGNRTPAAEFNIYADPHGASIVFQSGVPITMCGLDVTNRALIYREDIERLSLFQSDVARKSAQMLTWYLGFYKSFGFEGVAMHDPFTVAAAIDPSLAATRHLYVDVETEGEFTFGQTVVDILKVSGKKPNAHVALELDNKGFVDLFEKLMRSYG
ncbi:nucleoside hydrolase [Spirochaeta isovalerica]|uniref:Pyrimidine-specific ribonucleoside hydrolase n=1 Tax=Spirochaeta isovalerica TaxID=150 RepID=A0A841R8R6_9SPIO|nr:nucleoside hydrolase [Spirochaeta isovalerica]MBB6478872.1 pyrimidine-specific ribonucleoside hydrolase [Spirochaeta isovalerica]